MGELIRRKGGRIESKTPCAGLLLGRRMEEGGTTIMTIGNTGPQHPRPKMDAHDAGAFIGLRHWYFWQLAPVLRVFIVNPTVVSRQRLPSRHSRPQRGVEHSSLHVLWPVADCFAGNISKYDFGRLTPIRRSATGRRRSSN